MVKNGLAILLIAGALIFLYVNFNEFWPWNAASAAEQETEVRDSVETIKLSVSAINTKIVPVNSDMIRVEGSEKQDITVKDGRKSIEISIKQKGFQLFQFNSKQKNATVFLPEKYANQLQLEVGSGEIDTTEFTQSNPLTLSSLSVKIGSGDIHLGDLNAKKFSYDGSSGEAVIESLSTENGEFNLSSGDVTVSSYKGPLKANVSSGELSAVFKELSDEIDVSVSSGDVNLDLPDDADFNIKGKVSSGNLSNEFPLEDAQVTDRVVEGTHGKGTHQIHVNISSGELTLY
ncbi:DUF4097 family beta strand repeat-containing protein [Jeotgalibacillus campisalis]|uniref:DUF4097 domain-containing protein n=1 Tax=Jeotgalibacillus campisalis TaxID=220754 RepID=A0A0C2RQT7_9BACL|nr:DUF4097 family beta strand repeat-containing protein [Jeotgalibacillus campisalis]KIL52620.1 hypothetical protein KR50_05490 [Jeotgalibacillus campisalis]